MAILGDSIAAGSLSDFPIPSRATPEESVSAWRDQGLHTKFIYTNRRRLSWGSGTEITSHYFFLREWLRSRGDAHTLQAINVAQPGDRIENLGDQVDRLLERLRVGHYRGLKYVAMTIGSNDACATGGGDEAAPEELRFQLGMALQQLSRGVQSIFPGGESVPVLLIGVPRIPNLGTPAIIESRTVFGLSCSTVRDKILKYCNSLTVWQTISEYWDRLRRVDRINQVLRDLVQEGPSDLAGLKIAYSNKLFEMNLSSQSLAVDCFHPGRRGQQEISVETWNDQPWFH